MPLGIEAKTRDVVLRVLRADRLEDPDRHHVLRLGERQAWVTWLYWLRLKSKPPTKERTAPSCGLAEIKAPSASGSWMICQLSASSFWMRITAPGRILRVGGVRESSIRSANLSPSPDRVTVSPPRRYALTRLGVASSTSAARMSSLSG